MWRLCGEVLSKNPGLYQVPNWSYSRKTQKRVREEKLGDEGVLSEVQEKNPALYEVPNWRYGQKN